MSTDVGVNAKHRQPNEPRSTTLNEEKEVYRPTSLSPRLPKRSPAIQTIEMIVCRQRTEAFRETVVVWHYGGEASAMEYTQTFGLYMCTMNTSAIIVHPRSLTPPHDVTCDTCKSLSFLGTMSRITLLWSACRFMLSDYHDGIAQR